MAAEVSYLNVQSMDEGFQNPQNTFSKLYFSPPALLAKKKEGGANFENVIRGLAALSSMSDFLFRHFG